MLRERTRDGLAAARARGRIGGQRPADADKLDAARTLIRSGVSASQAARTVGLGRSTVYRALRDEIAEQAAS
ncbi:helix-turn-helix domain-containing protein [Gordonia sp. PP30]|uniref:helix-turn-helix domain-containing protein n=1 Tax=Gordonia sp. PP30 TaxID=2935861 RepID=UPI001FFE7A05|nr:helix-turn-helix domain-containing protein [Gordonia sp. PP30]UQE77166.1 helix-turn-helix domain-containing protein [Gordonia sp. PP30]